MLRTLDTTDFDYTRQMTFTEDSGRFQYKFANDFASAANRLNAKNRGIGKGYVAIRIAASYTDQDNKKHKGTVSNRLIIPAHFRR